MKKAVLIAGLAVATLSAFADAEGKRIGAIMIEKGYTTNGSNGGKTDVFVF